VKVYFLEFILAEGFANKKYAPTFASPYQKNDKQNTK
jgi:hypothetical protein